MAVVMKVKEIMTCGDFGAEITTEDSEIKVLRIRGKAERGTNELIIKNSLGTDLKLLDLKELVGELLKRYQ